MNEQHDPEDRCFYCATDAELGRALRGQERRTIHMQTPEAACPTWVSPPEVSVDGFTQVDWDVDRLRAELAAAESTIAAWEDPALREALTTSTTDGYGPVPTPQDTP